MDWLVIGLVGASIAIYAMVDISLRKITVKNKMIWFPIVILIPILGPLFYFIYRKSLV